ncbi:MAG: hypothetical protein Q7U35_09160 [Methanobacteriaceae archaeon]|nr:hypothetical protein [Methanobacteriaceae archaeon]MDP2836066.1 hypothetical protein [Methanobacteriaceae archaeon]MDP3485429.1 hypothetical protein [Methanobacteriaceae archaeon]
MGLLFGFIIKNTYFKDPVDVIIDDNSNHSVTKSDSQNITAKNNTTAKESKNNVTIKAESKYIYTKCKRCGKMFKQLKNGPGYYYCEKCEKSPEVQKKIEEEFQ